MIYFLVAGILLRVVVFYLVQFQIPQISLPLYSSIAMFFTTLGLFFGYYLIGKGVMLGKEILVPTVFLETAGLISSSLALVGVFAPIFSLFYFAFNVSLYSMRFGFMFLAAYMLVAAAMLVDFTLFRVLLGLSLVNFINVGVSKKLVYSFIVVYFLLPFAFAVPLGFSVNNIIIGVLISEVFLVASISVIFYLVYYREVWSKVEDNEVPKVKVTMDKN